MLVFNVYLVFNEARLKMEHLMLIFMHDHIYSQKHKIARISC